MSVSGVIRHARGVGTQMSVQRHKVANACTINFVVNQAMHRHRETTHSHMNTHTCTHYIHTTLHKTTYSPLGWDGMGWDGMGWDGMECRKTC